MRAGVWLVLLGLTLALGSCSGGYPLPATRCDEWCEVTRGGMCEKEYQPASCVAQCEQAELDRETCSSWFDAGLSCFRNHPHAIEQRCMYDSAPWDCVNETMDLASCAAGAFDNPDGQL